jgi:hypothetical protein
MKHVQRIAFTAVLIAVSAPAFVHHSGAMFDPVKEQTLVGTITEFNWTNPHSSFKVSVPVADGKSEDGWKRTTIKAGDKVTVVVHPLRDGKPGGSFVSIVLPDGKKLTGSAPGQNDGYAAPAATPAK